MANLLNIIINASEKAANIARVCRENQDLFKLLVEEKKGDEANSRFFQDFKTLADVLIQETVRHDVAAHFPVLRDNIYGEESNIFTNTIGETITVKVCSNEDETAKLYEAVLDGNKNVAKILASEVHKKVQINDIIFENDNDTSCVPKIDINIDNLGIWIDPIDSTAEYINAKEVKDKSGIYTSGLQCVTVLIGVYDKITGIPLIGVVNQPFNLRSNSKWQGKCYWGINIEETRISSCINKSEENKIILLSKVELDAIKTKLIASGYSLVEAAGAGYKLLSVITGLADAYIISQGTTFRWDTCGPHSIFRSLGGGIFQYSKALEGDIKEIDYTNIEDKNQDQSKTKKYCNQNGLIAVRDKSVMQFIVKLLRE